MAESKLEKVSVLAYDRRMAVIHITEAEAARDFAGMMAKVRAGEEVRIGDANTTIAVVRAPQTEQIRHRTLSEIIALMERRSPVPPADQDFADDIEEGMRIHRTEERSDPWA